MAKRFHCGHQRSRRRDDRVGENAPVEVPIQRNHLVEFSRPRAILRDRGADRNVDLRAVPWWSKRGRRSTRSLAEVAAERYSKSEDLVRRALSVERCWEKVLVDRTHRDEESGRAGEGRLRDSNATIREVTFSIARSKFFRSFLIVPTPFLDRRSPALASMAAAAVHERKDAGLTNDSRGVGGTRDDRERSKRGRRDECEAKEASDDVLDR